MSSAITEEIGTMKFIKKLFHDDSGATAIEYGLLAALIAVAALTAISSLAGNSTQTNQSSNR